MADFAFTPPFAVRGNDDAWWIEDAAQVRFAYTYYREHQRVGTGVDRPTRQAAYAATVGYQRFMTAQAAKRR